MVEIIDKIREIKYADEMDYIVEGLVNNEIEESLRLILDLTNDEKFKSYMKESRYLDEIIQVISEKGVLETTSGMVLEILSRTFNPYSLVDFKGLFKVLAMAFNRCEVENISAESSICVQREANFITEILEKIPIKWYSKFSNHTELRKVVFSLQMCTSRKVIEWNKFLISLLMKHPELGIIDDFASILLKKGRNYEVIANYTMFRENAEKLFLSENFRQCLRRVVIKEFIKDKDYKRPRYMLKGLTPKSLVLPVPETKKKESLGGIEKDSKSLSRKRFLIIILINLLFRDFHLDIPLSLIERAYYSVDEITRCYIAILLLSIEYSEKNTVQSIHVEDLKKDARHLLSISNTCLCEEILNRLIKISS
ncbi:uncharacterized protein Eint_021480 [Encephalitozoon intestinalis ATCC 50506]|uniref:Uncharacterized protein n=1 Tax=Encephalitozoon intestinalis (strain ATCC 50506) TaxID=876142 RepID=E0S609_ENCIT|nr:uncharacterized protein Eint_021480 [Encephalitozoon intestinalis ATCC 50506]ADM11144.2 hypothetical protein Eint_021480 [Encephalitozoon intestinalis ATCC 50506]UTX44800.1 hypothetical protein GPK93_02g03210 [Encephalitozoon intestinalis]